MGLVGHVTSDQYSPLYRFNNGDLYQVFTAIKEQEVQGSFVVNHREYPSASAMLASLAEQGIYPFEWDYLRTSTVEEAAIFIEQFRKERAR